MGKLFPVCLAEFMVIKALALMAVAIVVFLYWTGFKEKRNQRRERKWLEEKRRELKQKAAHKP